MRAEVKGFHSPDLAWGMEIPSGDCFGIVLQIFIGPIGGDGEESFDVLICTPDYLQKQVRESGIVDGRHHLIIDTFDHQKIEYYIQKRVASIESETWDRLAEKLGRIGLWEYEDYED